MKETDGEQVNELYNEISARFAALPRHDTETIRTLRREFTNRLRPTSGRIVVDLALNLIRRSTGVPRFLAYELVQHHREALEGLTVTSVEQLGHGIQTWGEVDAFACYLAGPVWRERQVSDALVRRWARSEDRWWRRAALASTVALNNKARGGQGDAPRTLMVCALLVEDRDDMVVKALSWALRELAKRDPQSTRAFLAQYEGSLASRVRRELKAKLETGLKNPRQSVRLRVL